MDKPRYTHLLLDADNTLFDFDKAETAALDALAASMGYTNSPQLIKCYHDCNILWWHRLERGEVSFDELTVGRFVDFTKETGLNFDPELMYRTYCAHLGRCAFMLPGAQEVISRLAEICELYIITNGLAVVQRARMEASSISGYIRKMFISQEIGFQKPRREYFDVVLSELDGVPRENILVIGDSLTSDIAGGAGAGLDTCWYAPEGTSDGIPADKVIGGAVPTYIITHLSQLEDIVIGRQGK